LRNPSNSGSGSDSGSDRQTTKEPTWAIIETIPPQIIGGPGSIQGGPIQEFEIATQPPEMSGGSW